MNLDKLFEGLKEEEREPMEDSIERLMGDEEMYMEYLEKFPDNQNIIEMRKAVDERKIDESRDQAHSLKGVAAGLGLLDLQDICSEMVWNFRNDKPEEGFSLMDEVQEIFDKWVQRIKEAK